ncbi:type II toxin-antitoxin system ParD family antitoxin [Nitrosococcus watsonii]|uniref:Antitoxin ParD n=1 Tax=Nitrosococcus watsoni (strain C-113) TaxID=105559 RepID=D8K9X1_NITWC|nr:type II toxin-antitoxin system ParD family antitoxin [Nitrosococcus watsonii]ADJ29329.1 putative addiction module antidote protein, CopG/Arc/MetJ family [Nitrosococcus watsonii C-113]
MANTSLSLGEHWETFIKNKMASGRYGSASEVVRDALRLLEARESKLEALRAHLGQGAAQAQRGEFVENYSIEAVIAELDRER